MPTSELRRQRGVPSSSRKLPITFFASLSRCHCSGSFSLRNTRIASSAGSAPTMNMMRQALEKQNAVASNLMLLIEQHDLKGDTGFENVIGLLRILLTRITGWTVE